MQEGMQDRDKIWRVVKPFVSSLIDEKVSALTAGSGTAVATHDLSGSRHSGTLADSQAPQFLLRDGSRSLTGNLAVGSGVTIDGIDIDVFNAAYLAHVGNADAHHAGFVGLTGDSGSAAPNGSDLILIAGGAGVVSSGSGSTLTVDLETPSTLSVSSTNSVGTGHAHAITSSSAPGAAASLLATNASGQLTLTGDFTDLSSVLVRQAADTQPRIGAFNDSSLRFGPGGATAPETRLRRTAADTLTLDDGAGAARNLILTGLAAVGRTTTGAGGLTITRTSEQLRLEYDAANYTALTVGSGGNLTMQPTGDLIFDPTGNDLLPQTNYDLNLGAINRKYLTLHAAELWVETLVAQDTIATIGGRILVGPTTTLTSDLAATGTDQTIARRSSNSATGSSTGPTLAAPSGTTNGDLLVLTLLIGAGTGTTVTAVPSGARLVRLQANTANTAQVAVYVLPVAGTPPTLTWTLSASAAWVVGAVAYQNVQLALPDNVSGAQGNASSTSVTVAAATTTVTNTMLVYVGGTATATTFTPPTGMTEVLDVAGTGLTLEVAELILAAAGSTGSRTGTAAAAASNAAVVLALAPRITSSMVVRHNQMRPGDVAFMEANGSVEFMSVVSGPTGSGPYTYTVARNLDGTSANAWSAGDAVFNTGQAGSGFLDLYSLYGISGEPLDFLYNFNTTGAAYSANYNANSQFALFGDGANTEVNDAVYFGVAGAPWNNIYLNLTTAAAYTATIVWEYWNGAWVAFTPTVTPGTALFQATGAWAIEWATASLTGWVATTINSQSAYWVRARISAFTSFATTPVQGGRRAYWRRRTAGPTITANVRNSTHFNDISTYAAMGNLNGLYDYGADTYGFAAGAYSATGITPWISADATNGFRVVRGSTVLGQWDTSGVVRVGQVAPSQGNVLIDSGGVRLRTNTTPTIDAQTDGDLFMGTNTLSPTTTFFSLFSQAQTYNSESMAAGDVLLGDNSASRANIKWTPANGRLNFRGGTTTQFYIDTTGELAAGGGEVRLGSYGVRIGATTSYLDARALQFYDFANSLLVGKVQTSNLGSGNGAEMLMTGQHPTDEARVLITAWAETAAQEADAAIVARSGTGGAVFASVHAVATATSRIDLNADAIVADGTIAATVSDTSTTGRPALLTLDHDTTGGAPAAGFGVEVALKSESSTTLSRDLATLSARWAVATDASRRSELVFITFDAASFRVPLTLSTTGSAASIGFLGASPIARPSVTGSRGGNAALASLLTALANLGLITDSSTA